MWKIKCNIIQKNVSQWIKRFTALFQILVRIIPILQPIARSRICFTKAQFTCRKTNLNIIDANFSIKWRCWYDPRYLRIPMNIKVPIGSSRQFRDNLQNSIIKIRVKRGTGKEGEQKINTKIDEKVCGDSVKWGWNIQLPLRKPYPSK